LKIPGSTSAGDLYFVKHLHFAPGAAEPTAFPSLPFALCLLPTAHCLSLSAVTQQISFSVVAHFKSLYQ